MDYQQLSRENNLPDFITMTNKCEELGYNIEFIRSRKGITCDLYKDGELLKVGNIIFKDCLEAQRESYTKLFYALTR